MIQYREHHPSPRPSSVHSSAVQLNVWEILGNLSGENTVLFHLDLAGSWIYATTLRTRLISDQNTVRIMCLCVSHSVREKTRRSWTPIDRTTRVTGPCNPDLAWFCFASPEQIWRSTTKTKGVVDLPYYYKKLLRDLKRKVWLPWKLNVARTDRVLDI